jgi:antitoxin MazE
MRTRIGKWGNSLGVRLPKVVADAVGLAEGQVVEITPNDDGIDLRPASSAPHHELADLVAEARRLLPEDVPASIDWGPDRGSEVIDDDYARGSARTRRGRARR